MTLKGNEFETKLIYTTTTLNYILYSWVNAAEDQMNKENQRTYKLQCVQQ